MDIPRLLHDVCWGLASDGLQPVAHMLNPSEQKELHGILYEHAQKWLLFYIAQADRERQRLRPSAN